MRRENEIACTIRPREAGEGDHWSSRSERTVVEGARASTFHFRRKSFVESGAPSTTLLRRHSRRFASAFFT